MADAGRILLIAAFVAAVAAVGLGGFSGSRPGSVLVGWVRRAVYATFGLVAAAVVVLQVALVRLDFSITYVAEHTSSTLSIPYRIGAMWSGQAGSLLLWCLVLALATAVLALHGSRHEQGLSDYTYAVLSLVAAIFLGLTAFVANPFAPAEVTAGEGMGLNPLLQDPLQLIHPILLYGGFILYTIPFGIAVGALIAGEFDGAWLKLATTWSFVAWTFLTVGIMLGARWAYLELGWGGYWAWDPVENASLIPWLSGTAALHAGLRRSGEQRAGLRGLSLLLATYAFSLFGTYITRSGAVTSVHAFAASNIGNVLGAAIFVVVFASCAVLVWRLPQLRSGGRSRRRFGIGLTIFTLVLMAVAVWWGTVYPLFARVLLGQEIFVTPGFFRVVVTPMAVFLLALLAFGPASRVQGAARRNLILIRMLVMVGAGGGLYLSDRAVPGAALVAGISAGALWSVGAAIWTTCRSVDLRLRPGHLQSAFARHLAHLGFAVLLSAITFNIAYQSQSQQLVAAGQAAQYGDVRIKVNQVMVKVYPDRLSYESTIEVLDADGRVTDTVVPMLERYGDAMQLQARVGIVTTWSRDIYLVLDEADATPGGERALISVYSNPGVLWIWVGGGLMTLGGLWRVWPRLRRRQSTDG